MTSPPSPGYLALLRSNVPFRRLWLGVVVSFFGDWFSTIALYTMVQALTDSGQALAGVLIAKTLPIFLMTPVAGPVIDRFDRRAVLLVTDVARALLTLGIVAGWWLDSVGVVLGVLLVRSAFSGVFIPARTAVVPQLTTSDELPAAMALSGGTWSVMLALGAAIGGLVTAGVGITGALLIDAATFLLSAVFLWGLPALPPTEDGDTDRATFVDGLRYLSGRVYLPGLLLLKAGLAVGIGGALVTLPLYGNGMFVATAGAAWIGVLYAARGAGALLGSVGVRRWSGDASTTLERGITPAYLLTGAGLAAMFLAPSVGWAALALFASAIGNGVVWVFSGILAQRATPREYRGRLFSLEFGVMTLVSATSSYAAGLALDLGWLGPREVNLVWGSALLLPAIGWSVVRAVATPVRGAGDVPTRSVIAARQPRPS